ncbi:MAG TPA: hypothetical protein VH814_05955 [Steroidobacteraceae bacterium]|jgi:hypothetical protein
MLQRHPLLLAEWLAVRNLVTRARAHLLAVVAAGAGIIVASAVVLLALRSQFPAMFAALLSYRVLVLVAVAVYAVLAVSGQRRRAEVRYTQFWLAAAPVKQYSRTLAILVVALLPLVAQLLAACALLAVMGVASGVDPSTVGETMLWIAGGVAIGAVIGWWSARRAHANALEGSRYVRQARERQETVPSTAALSGWPLAQVRAWGRPDNLRILLMVAMLAVQAGSSALVGLSVVAIWLLGGYLAGLLMAVLQTASAAARWLRSTPLPFAQFAWAVTRRALLYQVVATAVAVVLMLILGSPLLPALYVGALWLAIVLLACSIAVAESYRARTPITRIVLSFAAVAVVEAREHGWSIPLAAVLAAWHLRAGAKT